MQPSMAGDPRRIRLWVQVTTAMELDPHGEPRWLDAAAWLERRQQLAILGGPVLP
jgi:hypothetical protein